MNVVLLQTADLVECPVNPGHSVMHQSLDKHLKYCPLMSKGYSKNEIVSVYNYMIFLPITIFTLFFVCILVNTAFV